MSKSKSNIDLGMVIEWCNTGDTQRVLNNLAHFTTHQLNTPFNGGTPLLQSVVLSGKNIIVRALIDLGVDLDAAEVDMNLTALHYAA